MKVLFWISVFFIAYTYIGYPVVLFFWSKIRLKPVEKKGIEPRVSIIIAAYNEEKFIGEKIANCLALDYPRDKLEIIVISDGSDDRTNEIVSRFEPQGVRFYSYEGRKGKAFALNLGVSKCRGEIIFFTDARQILEKESVKELVGNFNDPSVGVVSGELILLGDEKNTSGEGIGLYWKIEKWMRKKESRIHSVLGATGSVYACRRELVKPIPAETVLDDVLIPFQSILQGYRAVFEPGAIAFDHVAEDVQKEFKRKVRTLFGNYQALLLEPRLLHPLKNPVFFQLMSHKIARLLVPFAMLSLLMSNLFIASGVYWISLGLQVMFYGLALSSKWGPNNVLGRIMRASNVILMMNYAALTSSLRFAFNPRHIDWKKSS
jgi:cellulose synthase/poly-beta-1,6-N-acetylglucosamine synthase-like glycosyltransferase